MKLIDLTEARDYSVPRTVGISVQDALELIEKNCQDYLRNKDGGIYRGSKDAGPATYGNSEGAEPRISANTHNYYTIWMDNHPKWAKFPKRSNSFICSQDYDYADGFGTTYEVYPYDDAVIGQVPSMDLWNSFPTGTFGFDDLDNFMTAVHEGLIKPLRDKQEINRWPRTYDELVKVLKTATEEKLSEIYELGKHFGDRDIKFYSLHLKDQLEDKDFNSVYDLFEAIIDPTDFKIWTPAKYPSFGGDELFIEGKCVFLKVRQSEKDQQLIDDFKAKYGL